MTIEKLISEYWAQSSFVLTLIVGLLGYFVKRVYDLKTQKQVTNHSLIQEHRIKAVHEFLNASTSLRVMFNSFPVYKMLRNEISAEEMDELVTEPLNTLKARALEVSIFFPGEQIFKEITGHYDQMNTSLRDSYRGRGVKAHETFHAEIYVMANRMILKRIDEKMELLTKMVGETYSIKYKAK